MAADIYAANQLVHRANIDRHRKPLRTLLTDHERQFIARRLADDEATLRDAVDKGLSRDFTRDRTVRPHSETGVGGGPIARLRTSLVANVTTDAKGR